MLELQEDASCADWEPDAEGFHASPLWGRRFRIETLTDRTGHPGYRVIVA